MTCQITGERAITLSIMTNLCFDGTELPAFEWTSQEPANNRQSHYWLDIGSKKIIPPSNASKKQKELRSAGIEPATNRYPFDRMLRPTTVYRSTN